MEMAIECTGGRFRFGPYFGRYILESRSGPSQIAGLLGRAFNEAETRCYLIDPSFGGGGREHSKADAARAAATRLGAEPAKILDIASVPDGVRVESTRGSGTGPRRMGRRVETQCMAAGGLPACGLRNRSSSGSSRMKITAMMRNVSRKDSMVACCSTMPAITP
jgi:hypothetical protein